MSRKQQNFDDCPICGEFIEILGFTTHWYDDKNYEHICSVCAATVKQCQLIEDDKWIVYDYEKDSNVIHLNTPEEMEAYGFDKKRAERSIKAVKTTLRKAKKTVSRS